MRVAKRRFFRGPRPRYRLSDLIAQMPAGPIELTEEMRAWESMSSVGKESAPDPMLDNTLSGPGER